jgi:SAM-dependent methyltransferase
VTLPVPPRELWEGYGETPEAYVRSGVDDFGKMQGVLALAGVRVPAHGRVLDFGCAAGRMLRCWPDTMNELCGADLSAPHIAWCQENLGPPFRFALTTMEPGLPFPDGYFDFAYAASVFTHIGDREDAWLRELRRVLVPGGMAYVTVHDEHTLDLLRAMPDHWVTQRVARELGGLPSTFDTFVIDGGTPRDTIVFHSLGFVRAHWGRWFRIAGTTPEAYHYQTAVLLEKAVG